MPFVLILYFILHGSPVFAKTTKLESCPSGQHWVRTHFRRAYVTSAGKVVSASNVKAHCRLNFEGYEVWQPKLKNGKPPDWPHKVEKFKDWSPEELEKVLEMLGGIPNSLWSSNIKNIYRARRSKDFPNPGSSTDGSIILYDSAFDENRNLGRILAHELAHQIYLDFSDFERESYWYPLNWLPIDRRKGIFVSRKDGYIQDDGRVSPEEDFANNVDSFLYEPEKLKQVTPYAYDWIKNHFGGNFKLKEKK